MAAEVTKLPQVKLPAGPSPLTPEQTYWRTFKTPQQIPSPSSYPITHISYPAVSASRNAASSSASNDLFAVTSGLRVQLYSIRSRTLVKTISRFDDTAHSGEIRKDGRVLVAGDDTGRIQVFDINSRAILKTWKEHKQPVWTTKFSPTEPTGLMSASDDKTVRLWDLPSQASTTTFIGHGDYVRSGAFMPGSTSNLVVSGSYDETVRLWDPRAPGRSVMTFKHAAPVETVLALPSGTTILAAADNQISVLDIVAARPLRLLKNHQKTVTALCLASQATRLVSGGLDGHMKVFETTGWNVVSGSKYPSPILSLSVIPSASDEDRHLAVGLQSGVLALRTRLSGQQKARERERAKEMAALLDGTIDAHDRRTARKRPLPSGMQKRLRGRDFTGEGADIVIHANPRAKQKKIQEWEHELRKAHYAAALDACLAEAHLQPIEMLTLLTALIHRSALKTALMGRDEVSLQPVLRFVVQKIQDPRYARVCVDAAVLVLELYGTEMGRSAEVDALVRRLHGRVSEEVERKQMAGMIGGVVDLVVAGGKVE